MIFYNDQLLHIIHASTRFFFFLHVPHVQTEQEKQALESAPVWTQYLISLELLQAALINKQRDSINQCFCF